MRLLRIVLTAAALIAGSAFASPTDPKLGIDYTQLANPQPTQTTGKKVEVIEFFMYHCPHCNALEPHLAAWVKKEGDNIVFRRVHIPFSGPNDPEAHMFITLEAMGKANEMHDKVLHAWHVERLRLNNDAVIADWVARNGIDKAKFLEYWNSFGVQTKMKVLQRTISNYNIDSAPTLIVDGRYMTSPSVVGATNPKMSEPELHAATIQVLDALVARAQKR